MNNSYQAITQRTDPREGIITIVFKRTEADQLLVEVTDNGVGISEDQKNYSFDTFYTTKLNGNGLGLSEVADIMKEYNGHAAINNTSTNQGCKVNLFFKGSFTIENPVLE